MATEAEYSTHDLYFAAYLMTIGTKFIRVAGDSYRRELVFSTTTAQADRDYADYAVTSAEVPALAYGNALKHLKSLVMMGR